MSRAAAVDLTAMVLGLANALLLMTADLGSDSSNSGRPHASNENDSPPTSTLRRSLPPDLMCRLSPSLSPAAPLSAPTPIMQSPLGVR